MTRLNIDKFKRWDKVTYYQSDEYRVTLFSGSKRLGSFLCYRFTAETLHKYKNWSKKK